VPVRPAGRRTAIGWTTTTAIPFSANTAPYVAGTKIVGRHQQAFIPANREALLADAARKSGWEVLDRRTATVPCADNHGLRNILPVGLSTKSFASGNDAHKNVYLM
jgi:hypothetical protein